MKILRIDDVSINTDWKKLYAMVHYAVEFFNSIWLNVSIGVQIGGRLSERPHDKTLEPLSDYTVFYNVNKIEIPTGIGKIVDTCPRNIKVTSHGLIHVDHILLHKSAQEMSIKISCSMLNTNIFVPPLNHWNFDTENICRNNGIKLIKYEDGWLHCSYNKFDRKSTGLWYTHSFNFASGGEFQKWLLNTK